MVRSNKNSFSYFYGCRYFMQTICQYVSISLDQNWLNKAFTLKITSHDCMRNFMIFVEKWINFSIQWTELIFYWCGMWKGQKMRIGLCMNFKVINRVKLPSHLTSLLCLIERIMCVYTLHNHVTEQRHNHRNQKCGDDIVCLTDNDILDIEIKPTR